MTTTSPNRTIRRGRHRRGFTFAELLATVVLIAIIMPVAMQTIALCTRLGGLSRKETEAASLARAKLAELIASEDWQSGSKQGDFGSDWPGYQWSTDISSWTDSVVSEISLTVQWQSQGLEREVTLATLAYAEDE